MTIMFEATLKNRISAHFAPVTITFPIPEDQYEQVILALKKSQIGDARVQDCLIDNVHAPNCPALVRMTGTMANVDELDLLAREMESFDRYEMLQFNAAVERFGLSAADELIDLSFCAREVTVISDFTDLEKAGKRHYLTVHGACDSEELENLDGKETALALISGQPGYVTQFGVVYDNGVKLEQAYNNAAAWRKLLISQQNKFSEAFHIPASALHWYAAYHDADTHPHIHMMLWTDQETVLKRDAVVKLRSVMTNSIFQAELENLYIRKDAAYKDVTEAARAVMHDLVDRMETVSEPPASVQQKLLELALELRTVSGKKQYAYLKKPLKDKVDEIVDELEKLPEVAAYYSVWNGVRDTLEGYYKNRPRQHNPLSQQKEFRAIKTAIIQEAERLRQQMEQESLQDEEPSAENTSTDASANPTLADENTSSVTSHSARLPSEYLLNSTIRLFHQMGQIFRENAAPPSNPMGIRVDSKRRKKLMQKRLAMGHKQDDHEQEQGYSQTLH